MEIEEETKPKIINNTIQNSTEKKSYFRVEKTRYNSSEQKEKNSKKIFTTRKDYNFSKSKAVREFKRIKPNNTNKFVTTMNITSTNKENNPFIFQKVIPKKLTILKDQKYESKQFNNFWKSKNIILDNTNNKFSDEQKINYYFNNINYNKDETLNNYRIKLMLVYFYSIKNLCKYINKNFFDFAEKENIIVDTFVGQIYQTFRILNMKINEFKIFYFMKDIFKAKIKQKDFEDILALKQNFQFMKNVLNKTMSENLNYIYINIENFCKFFSPCSEQIEEIGI